MQPSVEAAHQLGIPAQKVVTHGSPVGARWLVPIPHAASPAHTASSRRPPAAAATRAVARLKGTCHRDSDSLRPSQQLCSEARVRARA